MPSLVKKPIYCFYCGSRSAHKKDGKTRRFQCDKCEATNYLDKNGEITDVPANPSTPKSEVFATALPRNTSPTGHLPAEPAFCNVCLKNQSLLTNCLANYLPAEDDPNYPAYEAAYPAYRNELEQRYPQVCPRCEPVVRDRIKKSGYAAKSDVLTRALARGTDSAIAAEQVWLARGLEIVRAVWWLSLLVQMLWHCFGAAGMLRQDAPLFDDEEALRPLMVVGCVVRGVASGALGTGCSALLASLVRWSLYFGLAVLWYNPGMLESVRRPRARKDSTGQGDFYRIQIIAFCVRAALWWRLNAQEDARHAASRGTHGFALLFLLMVGLSSTSDFSRNDHFSNTLKQTTLVSHRSISTQGLDKFSFRETDVPLIDKDSFQYPATDEFPSRASPPTTRSTLLQKSASYSRPSFPITNLAPITSWREPRASIASTALSSTTAAPPTPPPDESDFESMDWEPVQQASQPQQQYQQPHTYQSPFASSSQSLSNQAADPPPTFMSAVRSPFYGRLPPAPKSMEHRLRNPPAPTPQFRPVAASKQRDFFQKMGLGRSATDAGETSSGRGNGAMMDGRNETSKRAETRDSTKRDPDSFDLRPPQWTLRSDLDAATRGTGLEDMFTRSFTIGDQVGGIAGAGTGAGAGRDRTVGADAGAGDAAAAAMDGRAGGVVAALWIFVRTAWAPLLLAGAALALAGVRKGADGNGAWDAGWIHDALGGLERKVRAFVYS